MKMSQVTKLAHLVCFINLMTMLALILLNQPTPVLMAIVFGTFILVTIGKTLKSGEIDRLLER